MRNLKTIIIAGIVLVVFVVASIIVINLPNTSDAEVSTDESEASSAETVYMINRNYDELVEFEMVPTERTVDEDTAYTYISESLHVTITKTTDEDGNVSFEYDASPDPGKFEYDTSKFRSMMYTLSGFTAKGVVEENPKDISIYGLDEPTGVVKTIYSDGTEIDIILGSMAPVDGDYYCMTSDSDTVYTIGSYVDSLLVRRPIEYRDITLFPTYEEEDIYANIDWVRLTERDGSVVEILWDQEYDNEYNTESSMYVMLQPYQVSGNDTTIKSYILDVVATLTLNSIIDDISEDELAEYGLDNPAKLEMTDLAGNSISLLIGSKCPNADYSYCMIEDTMTLLTCNTSAFAWQGVNFVEYMLRTAWVFSIEELESLDIEIGDDTYDLQVEHYTKKNANGNDADGVTGTLNGVEISETNVRRLFIKCLYFRIIDNLTEDEKSTAEKTDPIATITVNLFDESHVMEVIPISDRKYALNVDGVMQYYCNKKSLESLEKSLGYVLEGDELDFSFE